MTIKLKLMPIWLSLVLFGVPAAILYCNIYVGVPWLVAQGVPLIISFPMLLMIQQVLFIPVAFLAYKLEGRALTWEQVGARFRLNPIRGQAWLWVLGVFLVVLITEQGLEGIGKGLAEIPVFAPPLSMPAPFNPRIAFAIPMTEFMGTPLQGNWWILVWWLFWALFQTIGEELWWRGYILPRQELRHGQWAWVVNGLLWGWVFHACLKWHFIGMLPSMLLTPWLAQKLKSTYASFLVHFVPNLMVVALILPGIIGF